MKKDENQHFNQCSHEIIYKIIKRNFITDQPTLIFLALLVETQHEFSLAFADFYNVSQFEMINFTIVNIIELTLNSLTSHALGGEAGSQYRDFCLLWILFLQGGGHVCYTCNYFFLSTFHTFYEIPFSWENVSVQHWPHA